MAIVNFGSLNLDKVYRVPHFCAGGETILAKSQTDSVGGKGLNQSIAIARSGAAVRHAGMIGDGGETLRGYMHVNGIDTSLLQTCSAPQGHAIIQVNPAGQNCIIVYGGSNQLVSVPYIDETLDRFQAGDYLMLQNEISNVDHLITCAHNKGMRVVLNASPVDENLLRVDFAALDWLVVNEIECMAIADCNDLTQAYETLKRRYPDVGILLTMGVEGSVSWADREEIRQRAYPVKAMDTTGAGDTFVGYFVGCLANGFSRAEAMRHASMASAVAVSRLGAASSIPLMADVKKALAAVDAT